MKRQRENVKTIFLLGDMKIKWKNDKTNLVGDDLFFIDKDRNLHQD